MKQKGFFTLLSITVLLTIVLSACATAAPTAWAEESKGIGGGIAPEQAAMEPAYAEDAARAEAPAPSSASVASQAGDRLVIKNANLSIVVNDPEGRMNEISAMAERIGGFVVSSSIYKNWAADGSETPGAYVMIRVPSDLFQNALDEIRAGAIDIPTDDQSGQDVTAEYTDLQSRLRNLLDAEVMLRGIMEDATDTEDVLNAFNQLNYITEQIEVLKGQIKYYEESAAMSAISVTLIADESVQPIQVGPWDVSGVAKDAIQALVRALQSIAEALVWFFLYIVPVILVVGLPLLLIGLAVRARLQKRPATRKSSSK